MGIGLIAGSANYAQDHAAPMRLPRQHCPDTTDQRNSWFGNSEAESCKIVLYGPRTPTLVWRRMIEVTW